MYDSRVHLRALKNTRKTDIATSRKTKCVRVFKINPIYKQERYCGFMLNACKVGFLYDFFGTILYLKTCFEMTKPSLSRIHVLFRWFLRKKPFKLNTINIQTLVKLNLSLTSETKLLACLHLGFSFLTWFYRDLGFRLASSNVLESNKLELKNNKKINKKKKQTHIDYYRTSLDTARSS